MNAYESEIIKKNSQNLDDTYYILNSCAVTNEAERELVQRIKKIKGENPDCKIILTGCAAQISPEKYSSQVDFVLGNAEKLDENIFNKLANNEVEFTEFKNLQTSNRHEDKVFFENKKIDAKASNNLLVGDIMTATNFKQDDIVEYQGTRAIVQVQNGCNHRCTFCIIPYGRGNSRSVPAGGVVGTIRNLVENGYKEVVLTGIDLTDYGKDLPSQPTLSQLVHRILKNVPQLPRLRLSSIDVAEIDDEIFQILANEERFMPYFHLSLQSGDDMILKRMKRRHNREQILEFCQKASEIGRKIGKNIGFGADIIAGFPTETDAQFENSLSIIKDCNIAFGHIFPFSAKNGTPAAKMPQVPLKIRKERAKILRDETANQLGILRESMAGTRQKVLVEKGNKGHCENFVMLELNGDFAENSIVEVGG